MSSVDIIVPCYKYGRYLRQCVESVLDQEGVDVRVLILDDASPDETPEVGAALATDPRVEYRRHAVNRGHIATYNEGLLEWAAADYCLLLSADDCLTPGALRRVALLMDAHADVVLTYGRDIAFQTEELPTWHGSPSAECERDVISYEQFLEGACAEGRTPIQAPTAVVRTATQKKVGGFRREFTHAGDTELWLRLAAEGKVAVVDANQAFRRVHRTNMSWDYSELARLQQQYAAFDCHFREHGGRISGAPRLQQLLRRTIAEAAFWGASHAFDRGDVAACRAHLDYALELYPQLRTCRQWSGLRWKRLLGATLWCRLRPLADRLRGRVAS
jgi:glycosyltransferase involved in cell wall biosynthesis